MRKIVLGLASQIAAGKGAVTEYLIKNHGASVHRFSTMLRDILDRLYLDISRENMQKLSTILRQNFSEDILAKVVYEDVKKDNHTIIIADGARRLDDIKYLKKLPEFRLVFIETDMRVRYERIIKRGENADEKGKTFEQFKKDHLQEAESQIAGLKEQADFILDNNGTFDDLYEQIEKIVK